MFQRSIYPTSEYHDQVETVLEMALLAEMISAEQLHAIIQVDFEDIVLLDIRTSTEQQDNIIPGATLYPCAHDLQDRSNLVPFTDHFARTFNRDFFDLDKRYILICRTGPRAGIALKIMLEHGFQACELLGGIQEWQSKGFPLENRSIKQTIH